MPEHPGFDLMPVDGRSIVLLRVRPNKADAASEALQFPQQGRHARIEDLSACWLGPDQWLFTSDSMSAADIMLQIEQKLADQLHAATDMTSCYQCFSLEGPAARTLLAMGCGIDMHPDAFSKGQCVRTQFANVLLLIVAVEDTQFDLYLDRSHSRYLSDWLANSGEDPVTCDSNTVG
jgi:sarcosine oxidase subunit gamma